MIIATIFRYFGKFLQYYTPEEICVSFLMSISMVIFFVGHFFLGCCSALAVWGLYVYLITPDAKPQSSEYGVYNKTMIRNLGSHPQVSRRELVCDRGKWFEDKSGRKLILRGVNVCGSSKFPLNCQTHVTKDFYNTTNISFVGRPFPLEKADEHFQRIQACGLTFIRLLVTWEAIEHAGPGEYDEEYLEYLLKIVRIAAKYNIACMIDPHQDVWSRWTGGDGAPAWTLELVGFNISKLHESGASFTQQGYIMEHGDNTGFPCMHWPSNHHRLATATMFTLFFGGNDFCPNFMIGGQNVQDFLQGHYFSAFSKVANKLGGEENVIGFDSMNEPNLGMIGWKDLAKESIYMRQGSSPTFFESFQLGDGFATWVKNYSPSLVQSGKILMNPNGARAWTRNCVWEDQNIWARNAQGMPELLKPEYFRYRIVNGEQQNIDLQKDYFMPFISKFRAVINKKTHSAGQYLIFVDRVTNFETASISESMCESISLESLVWAPHWYDLVPLVTKSFRTWVGVVRDCRFSLPLVFGRENVVREYSRQLLLVSGCVSKLNSGKGIPTIIGEIGIPFDIDNAKCYRTNDYSRQVSSMNITISALDRSLLSGILWNYTPDHTHLHGDGWNGEDLSIFSADKPVNPDDTNIFAGGRAFEAIVRPYVMRCAGTPISMSFDLVSRIFLFEFRHSETELITAGTVIFVPFFQYQNVPVIEVSGCTFDLDTANQTLLIFHDETHSSTHTVKIYPALSPVSVSPRNPNDML